MTDNYSALLTQLEKYNELNENAIEIKLNEPMSRHTSFKIGGNASFYLVPHTEDALYKVAELTKESGVRAYFLGNATNVLFADEGFDGAVVSMSGLSDITVDKNCVKAGAGASVNLVCKTVRDNSLTGLEFAYGIPGSVGGAVYMNAGAYGGEIATVIKESTYLSLDDMTIHTIDNAAHEYGYRESVYKHTNRIILSATLELDSGNKDEISAAMKDYMNRRIDKQPLEYPSAGSVFKRYPGRYTGQMIEECGLKGYAIGGAEISVKHAGFIINKGGATAEDVLSLIEYIKKCVFEKFSCQIECEIIYVR